MLKCIKLKSVCREDSRVSLEYVFSTKLPWFSFQFESLFDWCLVMFGVTKTNWLSLKKGCGLEYDKPIHNSMFKNEACSTHFNATLDK